MKKGALTSIVVATLLATAHCQTHAAPPAETPVIQRAYLDAEITRQRQDIFDLVSRLQGLEQKTKDMPDGALLATIAALVDRIDARLRAVERLASASPPPSVSPSELINLRSELIAILNQGLKAPHPEIDKLRESLDGLTERSSELSATLERISAVPPGLARDQVQALVASESQKLIAATTATQTLADQAAAQSRASSDQADRLASRLTAIEKKLAASAEPSINQGYADDLARLESQVSSTATANAAAEQRIQTRIDAVEKALSEARSDIADKLANTSAKSDAGAARQIADLTKANEQMSLSLAHATALTQKLTDRIDALEVAQRQLASSMPALSSTQSAQPSLSTPTNLNPADTRPVAAGIEDPGPFLVFSSTKDREKALAARDKVKPGWDSSLSILLEDDGAGEPVFALYVGQYKTVDEARRQRSKASKLAKIEFKIKDRSGKIW